jgi:hypothetical protein
MGNEYARPQILVFLHNIVKRLKWDLLIRDERLTCHPLPAPSQGFQFVFTDTNPRPKIMVTFMTVLMLKVQYFQLVWLLNSTIYFSYSTSPQSRTENPNSDVQRNRFILFSYLFRLNVSDYYACDCVNSTYGIV